MTKPKRVEEKFFLSDNIHHYLIEPSSLSVKKVLLLSQYIDAETKLRDVKELIQGQVADR